MPLDRYSRRRMAIDKFNNRPPFDIKKSDDSTSIEDKEHNSTNVCNNCEGKIRNSAAKSYRKVVKYFEEIDGRYQNSMKNKNKNIIPKIIESFQKVTPKQSRSMKRRQKTDSLHTLYRNDSPNFGKNIPNHKIMKNLLQNYDNESVTMHDQCAYFDVIPSRDTNTNITLTKKEGDISHRVDKQTSTTGLVWPATSNTADKSQPNLNTSKSIPFNKNAGKMRSRIPQMRDLHSDKGYVNNNNNKPSVTDNYFENKEIPSNSELEYYPTKDNQNLHCHKKIEKLSKYTDKQNIRFINGVNKEFPQYKFNGKPEGLRKEQTYVVHVDRNSNMSENPLSTEKRKKEKSFVQLQVERYNKIHGTKNLRNKAYVSNNSLKPKNFQESRKNINKNYIDIMSSMRENLPNLGDKCVDSIGDILEWSDHVETDREVKFPKETRNAMENLMDSSRRVPLTKYTRSQNIQIQPAISIDAQSKTDYGDYKKPTYKKINQLPCSKNLLCPRGNHEGPCKLEKCDVKCPPPRCDNNRNRPKYKEFVK